jgi:hypothetical protein
VTVYFEPTGDYHVETTVIGVRGPVARRTQIKLR